MKVLAIIGLIFIFGLAQSFAVENYCRENGFETAIVPHPDPELCDHYIVCALSFTFVQRCEPEKIFLRYNETHGGCEPGYVETCELTTTTTTTTTPPPTTMTTTAASTTTTTTSYPQTTIPDNSVTLIPYNAMITITPTPIDTTTTITLRVEIPTPLTEEITTTVEIDNSFFIPEDYCEEFVGDVIFLPHPDPNNCVEFVLCVLGIPEVLRCQRENEIFYFPLRNCVPGDPVTCIPHITTTTTTPAPIDTTTTTTLGIETPTPPIEEKTTTTTTTIPVETPTPPIEQKTTTIGIQTNPPPVSTTVSDWTTEQPPLEPPELCVGNFHRFVPNPDSCYRFYYCLLSGPVSGECETDRIFSEEWQGCILGDRATCTPNLF